MPIAIKRELLTERRDMNEQKRCVPFVFCFYRASRARSANDLDRCLADTELALPHYRETARIYRAINHVDTADSILRDVAETEESIRLMEIARATANRG